MANTYARKEYQESDSVNQKKNALDQHQTTKPGEYKPSQYQQIGDEALNKYMNRDKFSYDLNGDALYQQYKNKYVQQGKMAMMDTMGQAQAMTGGYGNSYAQSVGQQAYNAQLQNLNDVVPELYQLAYDRYNQEGQDLLSQYSLAADRENTEYGRYQDEVSRWNAEHDRLNNAYLAERDFDYGKYVDTENFNYGQHIDERNYQYQQDRDKVADYQWQQQMDRQRDQDRIAQENWQKEFDFAQEQYKASLIGADGDPVLWYNTGTYDENGNPIFRDSEGNTQAFGAGINPYTGTKHPDAKHGTFSNGYQPNNIGGTPLERTVYTTDIYGKEQIIFKANGKYWLWNGRRNMYEEVDTSDIDDFEITKSGSEPGISPAGQRGVAGGGGGYKSLESRLTIT